MIEEIVFHHPSYASPTSYFNSVIGSNQLSGSAGGNSTDSKNKPITVNNS
jgi:hypothetical protein